MQRDRFTRTLVLAAVLILLAGAAAPPTPWINTGVPSDAFWIAKAFHTKTYDMIVAGDSRVMKGISPAAMAKVLPNISIYNYAFDHNAYTGEYLSALEALIDQSSPHKMILLGISPQSLTLEAARNNAFISLRENDWSDRLLKRYIEPYLTFFEPYNVYAYMNRLKGISNVKYFQHHHGDGWVASHKEPEDPLYQIGRYRGRFDGNQVSAELTRQLFDFVQRWRHAGITVLGMRLPTSAPMLQLENQHSGFDQERFVRAFEEAGGTWLDFNPTGYHSYDGSHLCEDAAIQLSIELASKIRQLDTRQPVDAKTAGATAVGTANR
ncbi:MAG: hypothetical protein C4519_04460 [Desulfobacteraceae bacterium]|nr:MAG: hypothetical protein C4519_04460 [Desulfobacteraceae bacterium]